ncbi:NACHT, LRR and PYD domains-containing protein 1 homolog [Gastrophryne carolinensis]
MTGTVGQDVMLPCVVTYKDIFLLRDLIVNWQTENDTVVHSFHYEKDQPDYQAMEFKGRTQMFPKEFSKGNLSLLLMRVKTSDAGIYVCHVILKHMQTRTIEFVIQDKELDTRRYWWTVTGIIFIPSIIIILIKFKCNRNQNSNRKRSLHDYVEIYRKHVQEIFLSSGKHLSNCIARTLLIPEWRTRPSEPKYTTPRATAHNTPDAISSEDLFTMKTRKLTSHRMLLAGEAGIGKSSFSEDLLQKWALGHQEICYDCVVYFTFTELNAIKEPISLNTLLRNKCKGLEHVLSNLLETRKLLIIFDGMDEFKLTENENFPQVSIDNDTKLPVDRLLLNILCKVLLPNTDILVTSRFNSVNLSITKEYFDRTFILKELSDDEMKQFCKKSCSEDNISQNIFHFIQEHNLSSLASIPLLSGALCELSKNRGLSQYTENLRTRSEMMVSLLKLCLMNAMSSDIMEPCCATKTNAKMRDMVHKVTQLSYENLVTLKEEIRVKDLCAECVHTQQLLQELCVFFFKLSPTLDVLWYRHASIRDMFAALHCVWEIQNSGGAMECIDFLDFWVSGTMPNQHSTISILHNIPSTQSVEFHNFISFFMGFMYYKDIDSLNKEKRDLNSYEVLILQNYFETWLRSNPVQTELLKLFHCIYELHNDSLTDHFSNLLKIVDLFDTPLNALDITAIQYCLHNSRMDKLDLNLCDLRDENLQRLEVIIRNSTHVTLTSNMLTSKSGKTLRNILEHPSCVIKELFLATNHLGAIGVQQVWKALEVNTSLETLNLCDNDIQDAGTENMVSFLGMNTTLKNLTICMNVFTERGTKNITELIAKQPNLKIVMKTTEDEEFFTFVENHIKSDTWQRYPRAWVLHILSLLQTELSNADKQDEKVTRLTKDIADIMDVIKQKPLPMACMGTHVQGAKLPASLKRAKSL